LGGYERAGQLVAGPEDPMQAGNGSLMRLAPIAIFAAGDANEAKRLADQQSRTTHPAPAAHDGCRYFARLLTMAITGSRKADVLNAIQWKGTPEIAAIAGGGWRGKTRHEISSSGYVVHTLEAAIWCVDQSDSLEDALVLAVNLGDDADTVGAVTGQLAGAIWGSQAIPDRWLKKLAWREHLIERAEALLGASSQRNGD
jgi:ADP-ribosyl-[dinitrogen reductase] hydrolase